MWSQTTIPKAEPATTYISEKTRTRDVSCRVTNHKEETEAAHIIPDGESNWFHSTALWTITSLNEDARNRILLRRDVHALWDKRHFSIVPRRWTTAAGQVRTAWVVYATRKDVTSEVVRLYHDVRLQPLTGVPSMLLFCRFAYNILDALSAFLKYPCERWISVRSSLDGSQIIEKASKEKVRDEQYTKRTKSQSPHKRSRPAESAIDDVEDLDCGSSGSSTFSKRRRSSSTSTSDLISSEDEDRGRKRRRWDRVDYIDSGQSWCSGRSYS